MEKQLTPEEQELWDYIEKHYWEWENEKLRTFIKSIKINIGKKGPGNYWEN